MIEIRITADNADTALAELVSMTRALSTPRPVSKLDTPDKPGDCEAQERPTVAPDDAPAAPVSDAPASAVPTSATAAPTPAENNAPASAAQTAPEVTLTLEAVRAAGITAARKHGKPAIAAVLESLGEKGMTSMSPDNYGAFMRKLGELDAG